MQNEEQNGKHPEKEQTFHRKLLGMFLRLNFLNDCSKLLLVSCRVSDKIPLQKEVSYDSIEIFDQSTEDAILLNIISYDGRFVNLRLSTTTTIYEVKWQALTELGLPTNIEQSTGVPNYKILKPSETMPDLDESLSITQNALSDYGKRNGHELIIWIELYVEFLQMNFC